MTILAFSETSAHIARFFGGPYDGTLRAYPEPCSPIIEVTRMRDWRRDGSDPQYVIPTTRGRYEQTHRYISGTDPGSWAYRWLGWDE